MKKTFVKYILSCTLIFFLLLTTIQPAFAVEATIDSDVHVASASYTLSSPAIVFTSDQVGYAFYRDSGGACVYSKTTNGGTGWGSAVTVDSQTDCLKVQVWYDQWTPGDTTGTNIHILTIDGSDDDLFYTRMDTSSDSLTTPVSISGSQGGTLAQGENFPSITKATDGDLYAAVIDDADGYAVRCTGTCTTGSNWSEAGTSPFSTPSLGANPVIVVPLASGNIMAIRHDQTANVIDSIVYTDSGSPSWDGAWTTVLSSVEDPFQVFYLTFGTAVNKLTNDIYLTFTDDAASLGTNDDIKTALYSGGSWTVKTDVLTDDSKGLTASTIALNQNNNDVYVFYTARTTPATGSTGNVYYKRSTDGMTTWGSEQGPLNTTSDDLTGPFVNYMSQQRLFAAWRHPNSTSADSFHGDTVVDLTPPTYEQVAYRWFDNDNATTVTSAKAAQSTAGTLSSDGEAFRLRLLLHVAGDGAQRNLDNLKLQFAPKSGASCGTYADITSSSEIAYKDNSSVTDGASLTANGSLDPTHGSDTVRNQTYEEANNFTNSQTVLATGEDGMWDFSLYDNTAPNAATYCFRVVKSDDTTLTYTVTPEITTFTAPTPTPTSSSSSTSSTTTGSSTTTEGPDTVRPIITLKKLGKSTFDPHKTSWYITSSQLVFSGESTEKGTAEIIFDKKIGDNYLTATVNTDDTRNFTFTTPTFLNGKYKVTLRAKDQSGNVSHPITFYMTVDTYGGVLKRPLTKNPPKEAIPALPSETKEEKPREPVAEESATLTPTPSPTAVPIQAAKPTEQGPNIFDSLTKTLVAFTNETSEVTQGAIEDMKNAARKAIGNAAFAVGEKTQDISSSTGHAIVKFGYMFIDEPTTIYDVKVKTLSPTSAKISWMTNHPANGKVNYGLDETYPFDIQSEKRVTHHEFTLTNLQPNTQYHFEVMSHNKNYVYDANRKFTTPAK